VFCSQFSMLGSGNVILVRAKAEYRTCDAAADQRGNASVPARQARATATKRRPTARVLTQVRARWLPGSPGRAAPGRRRYWPLLCRRTRYHGELACGRGQRPELTEGASMAIPSRRVFARPVPNHFRTRIGGADGERRRRVEPKGVEPSTSRVRSDAQMSRTSATTQNGPRSRALRNPVVLTRGPSRAREPAQNRHRWALRPPCETSLESVLARRAATKGLRLLTTAW
jgi:hypothetical protein